MCGLFLEEAFLFKISFGDSFGRVGNRHRPLHPVQSGSRTTGEVCTASSPCTSGTPRTLSAQFQQLSPSPAHGVLCNFHNHKNRAFTRLSMAHIVIRQHFTCAYCTKFLQLFAKYLFYEVLQHYHQKMA